MGRHCVARFGLRAVRAEQTRRQPPTHGGVVRDHGFLGFFSRSVRRGVAVLAVATIGGAGFVTLASGPAAAATTGTITGKVTAAAGGSGLSGICVGAYVHGADPQQLLVDTATVANGNYTLANVPAGSVDVRFNASGLCPGGTAANRVTQWYNNQRTQATATTVIVSAGA